MSKKQHQPPPLPTHPPAHGIDGGWKWLRKLPVPRRLPTNLPACHSKQFDGFSVTSEPFFLRASSSFHFSLFTLHSSLFTLHFSLFTFHSSLFTFLFSLFTLSLFTFHLSLFTFLFPLSCSRRLCSASCLVKSIGFSSITVYGISSYA